jgi:hypothetical protein
MLPVADCDSVADVAVVRDGRQHDAGMRAIAESGAVLLAGGSRHDGSATAAGDLMDPFVWRVGKGP